MDLLLTVLAFALALLLLFVPFAINILWLLQVLLVILLGMLLLLLFFQAKGRKRKAEAEPAAKKAAEPRAATAPATAAPETLVEAGVVQFLGRLQEKGRLIDFLMDDITPYANEQVGVVARVVHQGCREVLKGAFDIEPVHAGKERDAVSFSADFDAASYRLVGKVPDRPPYQGTVLHRGWKATRISLPRITGSSRESTARTIIAPAEVEIG